METKALETNSSAITTFLSPTVRKLYISATALKKEYIRVDEIENYIQLENLTFLENTMEQLLDESLVDITYDENSRLLSSEKISHKDVDFYAKSLKRLCPIFYMCHLALTSHQITKEDVGSYAEAACAYHSNDELVAWVSDKNTILGCMQTMKTTEDSIAVTENREYLTRQLQNIRCRSIRTNTISALLLITSTLERSLGDLLTASLVLKGNRNIKELLGL